MTSVLTCHAIQTPLNKCSIVSVSNTLRAAATYYGLKTSLLSWRHSHLEIQEAPLLTCWEIMSTTNNRKMKKCKNNTLKWRVANVFPEMKVLPKRISPVNCHFIGNTLLSMETNKVSHQTVAHVTAGYIKDMQVVLHIPWWFWLLVFLAGTSFPSKDRFAN